MYRSLYKDKNPVDVKWPDGYEKSEYRQLILQAPQPPPPEGDYVLKLMHGWWVEEDAEPKHSQQLLKAFYETWTEGEEAYKEQLLHCVGLGFIHAFHFDPLEMKVVYEDLSKSNRD